MKPILRPLFLPLVMAVLAIGAAYGLGRAQERYTYQADPPDDAPPPANLPRDIPTWELRLSYGNAAKRVQQALAAHAQALQQAPHDLQSLDELNVNLGSEMQDIFSHLSPADVARLAATLPDPNLRDRYLWEAADQWLRAGGDRQTILNLLFSLSPDENVQNFWDTYFSHAGDSSTDPSAISPQMLMPYLDRFTNSDDRGFAMEDLAEAMARTDPAAALDWLIQNAAAGTDFYEIGVARIFEAASVTSKPPLTLSEAIQNASEDGPIDLSNYSSAAPDFSSMDELLDKVSDPDLRAVGIAQIAHNWSMTDPAAAAAWAAALPDSDRKARTSALVQIVSAWADQDPAAAIAYMQSSPDPSIFVSSVDGFANTLAAYDPADALSFLQSQPPGPDHDEAISSILTNLAATDPGAAWTAAANQPAGPGRDAAMAGVLAVQAKADPEQAAALLSQFADGPALQNATRTLVQTWAGLDVASAATWAGQLPAGAEHDAAALELATALAPHDPTSALAWADSIASPNARAAQLQQVFATWAATNPAAAANALSTVNLTAAQRATLALVIKVNSAVGH